MNAENSVCCPECDGSGWVEDLPCFENAYGEHGLNVRPCNKCPGKNPEPSTHPDTASGEEN